MKIWIDLINPSDVFFFEALLDELQQKHQIFVTARDRSETIALAHSFDITPKVIGKDFSNRAIKTLNHALRTIGLFFAVPRFDVALAFGGSMSIAVSKARFKPSIVFNDNDLIFSQRTLAGSFETKIMARASYIIMPSSCSADAVVQEGARKESIYQFDGYKEDVYIADYKPDPDFLQNLPFSEFVVLRPEALFAAYVTETKSIVPLLLRGLPSRGINVVYLPRIGNDLRYLEGIEGANVFIPKQALNGLDLCWYADAVLTGSGTFAREAACLGTTAVSFFPERLLAVDEQLVSKCKMLHSRNVDEIMAYVLSKPKEDRSLDLERCRKVKQQVSQLVRGILERIG